MIFRPSWTFFRGVYRLACSTGGVWWLIAWQSANDIYIKYRQMAGCGGRKLTPRSWPNPGEVLSVRPLVCDSAGINVEGKPGK